jgi:hypothetical protein
MAATFPKQRSIALLCNELGQAIFETPCYPAPLYTPELKFSLDITRPVNIILFLT